MVGKYVSRIFRNLRLGVGAGITRVPCQCPALTLHCLYCLSGCRCCCTDTLEELFFSAKGGYNSFKNAAAGKGAASMRERDLLVFHDTKAAKLSESFLLHVKHCSRVICVTHENIMLVFTVRLKISAETIISITRYLLYKKYIERLFRFYRLNE